MIPYFVKDCEYALGVSENQVHLRLTHSDGQQARISLEPEAARGLAHRIVERSIQIDQGRPEGRHPQRRVVCSAIRCQSTMVIGIRHHDSIMNERIQEILQGGYWDRAQEVQGFIDQWNVFMTRTEAWQVAYAAGQIVRRCGGDTTDGGTLYSENLY